MTQAYAEAPPRRSQRRQLAAAVLMVGALTDMIDVSIVNVALPTIGRKLGAGSSALEWIVSAYMLAFAAVLIVAGGLGDLLGRRRLFLLGTALFGAASLGAGLASSSGALIAFRTLQGAAAATMIPQVLATFRVLFPRSERGVVFGIYGAVLGLAAAAGVTLGGVIVDPGALGWGWRGIFLVNVPVCALALLGTLWLVPESVDPRRLRPDFPAALGLVVSLVALVFPLLEGRRLGWPAWSFLLLSAGLIGLARVARRGARVAEDRAAVLPPRLLRIPAAACGLAIQLVFSAGLQGLMLSFALFLQAGQHASPLTAGLTLLAFSAGGVFTAPQSSALAERYGRAVLLAGAALLALGVGGMVAGAHAIGGGPGPWPLVPGLLAAGAGLGLLVVPLVNVVLAAVPAAVAGSASGVFSTAQQLGGALGVALIGTVFFGHSGGAPTVAAFTAAAAAAIGAFLLCGALCLALPRTALSEEDVLEIVAGDNDE
jgi:EmrB/QacA subfamily drug resistance transporter